MNRDQRHYNHEEFTNEMLQEKNLRLLQTKFISQLFERTVEPIFLKIEVR